MKFFGVCFLIAVFTACGVQQVNRSLEELEDKFQHHSGFALYDLENDKFLIKRNHDRYFTPASNTKILTLYTSFSVIGDSIPGLYYHESPDSLIIWGTGDPALLYQDLPKSHVLGFLKDKNQPLYFSTSNFYSNHFGPGWSWDDYLYTFSSEKSPLPVYGNALTIRKQREAPFLNVDLPYFHRFFFLGDSIDESQVTRSIGSNELLYEPAAVNEAFKREVPFRTTANIVADLLADTLNRSVTHIKSKLAKKRKPVYSIPSDSAYQVMMQESDNFIAEQLLLVCSGLLGDSLKSEVTIRWAQDSLLKDSPDPIIWKDGSGLSRYNLITPQSTVWLWKKLYQKIGQERLFNLIAAGGESGTLKNYYKADKPYIFGKTGTLSNNHSLSGFLITKKGKVLIFSFMNNNYPTESRPVKLEMERILWDIHLNY